MRVLSVGNMYPPASMGGYELVWQRATEHQRRRGHEVRVLTSDHRAAELEPNEDVRRELHLYWSDHGFPSRSLRARLGLERANAAALDAQLRAFEPDAVNWWAMGGMSLSLIERVRRAGVPAVGVVCDDWMLYGPRVDAWTRAAGRPLVAPIAERLTGIPARLRLGDAATWVFLTETLRRRAKAGGIEPRNSLVANRGPDDGLFAPAPQRPWGGRLLYIGRIDERKGIATAIEALSMVEGATLAIDGSGDEAYRAELERRAAHLGVSARVSFRFCPRDQVPSAYAAADVVVFPVAWDEPWGLVPLEAMAMGRPVIATGAGGSGEYLRDGENCLLFEQRDAKALAAAIQRLAVEPELRSRLRTGGLETVSRFTEATFNEAIERALVEAAAA